MMWPLKYTSVIHFLYFQQSTLSILTSNNEITIFSNTLEKTFNLPNNSWSEVWYTLVLNFSQKNAFEAIAFFLGMLESFVVNVDPDPDVDEDDDPDEVDEEVRLPGKV